MVTFDRLKRTNWLQLHETMQLRHQMLQDISFAQISQEKDDRVCNLRGQFGGKVGYGVYVTDTHLKNIALPRRNFFEQHTLSLKHLLENGFSERISALDGCVVVLNNADIDSDYRMEAFSAFYNNHPNTIFIGWDTDNHHTLQISMAFATLVDFYVQTQIENFYDLSRFNPLHAFVPTGLLNMSRAVALGLFPEMLAAKRSDEPRGYFGFHGPFTWRNRIVTTLSEKHPNIGFFDDNRGFGVADNYLMDLIGFKTHWVVPVLNDASARIHEILATGGIPVVPQSLRYHPALDGLSDNHIVYYSLSDVLDTNSIVKEGLRKFDTQGLNGMRARFDYAMSNHSDFNLMKILRHASKFFGFEIS